MFETTQKLKRGQTVRWHRGGCNYERATFVQMTTKHDCTIITERGMLASVLVLNLELTEESEIEPTRRTPNRTNQKAAA